MSLWRKFHFEPLDVRQRIDGLAVLADLEMQVGPGHSARGPDFCDQLAPPHLLSLRDEDLGQMPVKSDVAVRMGDLNEVPVAARNAGENNLASRRGIDRGAVFRPQIHARVVADIPGEGIGPFPEGRGDDSPPAQWVPKDSSFGKISVPLLGHANGLNPGDEKDIAFF